ncbi:MAG: PrsW family glutamic-type intramembrane protease [Sphingomicrobium sp.]
MNIAEIIDWSLALVPVLLMALLFAWLDVFKLMSKSEMVGLLLLGGVTALAAYPISGQMLDRLPMGFSFYSRMVAPWIEEALKGLAVVLLVARNRIGFKLDAVISGFTIGAGFSVIENIIYLTRFPELAAPVWMVRGLGTAVMHGAATAILATIAHELGERAARAEGKWRLNPWWFAPGYVAAGVIHTVFNQFPDQPGLVMLVTFVAAPAVLLGLLRFGEGEAQTWLAEESATHGEEVTAWQVGGYPRGASGGRIAALVARVGPEEGAIMRDYCALKTQLVLAAEIELLDRGRAIDQGHAEKLRGELARLKQLRHDMGLTAYAALEPLLPFSRNDRWELDELRELLGMPRGD